MARTLDYSSGGGRADGRYYRHSNRVTVDGVLFGVLAGLAVGLPAAVGYAYLTAWGQFAGRGLVILVIAPVAFGAALGFISARAMRLGKVRSVPISLAVVGATAAVCYAIHWIVWCYAMISRIDNGLTVQEFLQDPGLMGQVIGARIQSPLLVFAWLGEAALVLGSALYFALGPQNEEPFCEKCGMWSGQRVIRELRMCDHARLRHAMESGDWRFLNRLGQATSVTDYISIIHHQCPCRAMNTLSAYAIETSTDSDGEKQSKTTRIVNKLLVSPKEVQAAAGEW